MDGQQIQDFAAEVASQMPGAVHDRPFGPETDVYRVGGKLFLLSSSPHGRPLVNLKVEPEHSVALRDTVPGVEPGWHMNKKHWITLAGSDELTPDVVRELVRGSYVLVVESLPRRLQPVNWHDVLDSAADVRE